MDIDKCGSISPDADLRHRAEARVSSKPFESAVPQMDSRTQRLIYELQISQIELEMQNDELLRVQSEHEVSRNRYFELYEMSSLGYLTISEQGLVLNANLAAAAMLCVERNAMIMKPLTHFIFTEDQDVYYLHRKRALKEHEGDAWDMRLRRSDGSVFWGHLLAAPAHNGEFCINFSDVTRYKQAEQSLFDSVQMLQETRDALVQFEKEAAVGRLVAGVAHELLNPVSIICSRLQFMEDEALSVQGRDGLRICQEQLKRVVKISQDLNQLSTLAPRPQVSGDLRLVIELGLAIAEQRILEEQISVDYSPPAMLISVKMERDALLKAMSYLILNACDALLQTEHKHLSITVRIYPVTDKPAYVSVIVADNGSGIADGDMNKIFDPFFTTKDPKKGTGLGLTLCRNILATHGGKLKVENNDQGGASFIMELPLSSS